jgi:hypothetical protein
MTKQYESMNNIFDAEVLLDWFNTLE